MNWEDGGPLDPPELPEVDCEAFLAAMPCGACERKDGWREAGRDHIGDLVWRCVCDEYSWTETEIWESLAEKHEAANDPDEDRFERRGDR